MPEYLSPGVYVTEVALSPRPIEGVSASTTSFLGAGVIGEIQKAVNQISPIDKQVGGTGPGIALLELIAWITDELSRRVEHLENEAYLSAAHLTASALAILTNKPAQGSVIRRVRFYPGQLLSEEDLKAEVDYSRELTRATSAGSYDVVSGLNISVQDKNGSPAIHVSPGYAVDKHGSIIFLKKCISLLLPMEAKRLSVIARPKGDHQLSISVLPLIECEYLVVDAPKNDDLVLGSLEKLPQGWRTTEDTA
jgi:hypothetical protein